MKNQHWLWAGLFIAGTTAVALIERYQTASLIAIYLFTFAIYLFIIQAKMGYTRWKFWLFTALAARFILVFIFPGLSDDVFRFLWDGSLIAHAHNPYIYLPSNLMLEQLPWLNEALFEKMNSPEYYTAYPPVCQVTFVLGHWLSSGEMYNGSFWLKVFVFIAEAGSIYLLPGLLRDYGVDKSRAIIYGLNPLIILELCGNLHYEALMIFFLLLSWRFMINRKLTYSAVFMALSVGSKLLSLLFLPFILKQLNVGRRVQYLIYFTGALIPMFGFVLLAIPQYSESLDLYFRKFEFNGSIYYVLRWVGMELKGYNWISFIGPLCSLFAVVFMMIGFKRYSGNPKRLAIAMLFAISVYLLFATTVHPWYLALPIVLCPFTRFRFPVYWSGLIFLTYIHYSFEPFKELPWLLGIEYAIVFGIIIWEISKQPLSIRNNQ